MKRKILLVGLLVIAVVIAAVVGRSSVTFVPTANAVTEDEIDAAAVSDSPAPSPSELTEVGRIEGGPAYQAIHASGEFVYGLVYRGGWLEIVDVSDPANPFIRSSLDLPFSDGHDLWYGEWNTHRYVFTGHRFGGVSMVDVSNPDAPTVVSTANTIYNHKGIQSVGHYLYYCEHPAWAREGGLRIYDFASGTLMELGNWLQGPPCAIDGKELAVRSDGTGVYQYDEWHPDWDDEVCGGPNEKALFYDTTDKSAPSIASYFLPPDPRGPNPKDFTDMVLSPDDRYLYLAHGENGVLIYDVSISSAPNLIATVGESLYEVALDPEERVLYTSSAPAASALYVIDVRNPANPNIVGTMPDTTARDLWFDGDYLYATTEEAKLIIYEAVSLVIQVPVDIKPGSCPNPLNVKSKGVLPVAILGTSDFDVTQVDPALVRLEGGAPLRWDLEDVAAPFEPFTGKEEADDCTDEGPDGFLDLTLKFDAQEIVAALGDVNDGDVLVLTLTGNLLEEFGGTPIQGEDVVVILKKGKE